MKKQLGALLLYACTLSQAQIPLMGTVKLGSHKLTLQQLESGANPNQVDELGNTPLHYAAHVGCKEIAQHLLEYGADPNSQNNKDKTPLHIAVQQDKDAIVRLLLRNAADPNIKDAQGNTALHLATSNAHMLFEHKIVKSLLCNGADTHSTNLSNETPLTIIQHAQPEDRLFKSAQATRIDRIAQLLKHSPKCASTGQYKPRMSWTKKLSIKRQKQTC